MQNRVNPIKESNGIKTITKPKTELVSNSQLWAIKILKESPILSKENIVGEVEKLIQSIFGFDAQQRLDDFHAHECITWLPVLHDKPMASIKKKINWRRNELGLVISDYEDFKQQVRSQYMAGYNTAYKAVHKG